MLVLSGPRMDIQNGYEEWRKAEESELGGAGIKSSLINYVRVSIRMYMCICTRVHISVYTFTYFLPHVLKGK